MSTSSKDAARDIEFLEPSTSSSPSLASSLNIDILDGVMKHLIKSCPIGDALRLKNVHYGAHKAVLANLKGHNHLRIEFHEQQLWKVVGGKKVALSEPLPNIVIQGTRVRSHDEALRLLKFVLREMRLITRLSLDLEDTEQDVVREMLVMVKEADNVQLEVLQCKRRHGGHPIPLISDLIKANASTLKILGRVGVLEAAQSFSDQIHLDRLSLMTLDLTYGVMLDEIKDELAVLQQSGATFTHLSYTSFDGFDPTDDKIQNFLTTCGVQSLRLTMMQAPFILTKPDYMIGKVRAITHLEIGEVVDKPCHYNRLIVHEAIYKKVFPNAGHITFFQTW